MTRLYRLAVLSAVSTYLLIILGGITRVSGSGLGCKDDWPLCQGKPYPPLDTIAIVEYLNRTVAAYIGFLLILSGGATSTSGAALACWEWPTCGGGRIVPDRTSKYTWINLSHRTAAI